MQINKNYFKIVQITDFHLFKEKSDIFGVDSNKRFKLVIDELKITDLKDTDAIFVTGDLSQDETIESYQLAGDLLTSLKKPIYWIAGNHDCQKTMQLQFSNYDNLHFVRKLETIYWDFIFLSTKKRASDSGFLLVEELRALHSALQKSVHKNIALIMHHHPIPMETPIIDNYLLENNEDLFNLLDHYKIYLIICGHVHNDYTLNYQGIDIQSAPATCLQFNKGATTISDIDYRIGYKVYCFMENGYDYKTKMWLV